MVFISPLCKNIFSWLQIFHHWSINTTMKTKMSNIVSVNCSFFHLIKFCLIFSIKDSLLKLFFWIWDPHHLHFILILSKTQMNLFVTCFGFDVYLRKVNKLFKAYISIFVKVEGIKCRVEGIKSEVMIGFNEFEIIAELGPSDFLIIILIISQCKKLFEVLFGCYGCNSINKSEEKNKMEILLCRYFIIFIKIYW